MSKHEYGARQQLLRLEQEVLANRRMMDDISAGGHRRIDTARPTLGFPLGTALILLIVFGISALFSCCYHWEKIRSMHSRHHGRSDSSSSPTTVPRANFASEAATSLSSSANISHSSKNSRPSQQGRLSIPVVMPGDNVPKFIACPSPHGFAPRNVSDVFFSQMNQSKNESRSRP